MSKKEPSGRLARWALKIQKYNITIGYRPGKTHQNADCLSRIPILPAAAVITFVKQDWKESQETDEYCKEILENLKKENGNSNEYYLMAETGVLVDKEGKIMIPKCKVKEILKMNHDHMLAGHLGRAKKLARIRRPPWCTHRRQRTSTAETKATARTRTTRGRRRAEPEGNKRLNPRAQRRLENLPSDMPSNNTFGESINKDVKEDTSSECRGETENPATGFKTEK